MSNNGMISYLGAKLGAALPDYPVVTGVSEPDSLVPFRRVYHAEVIELRTEGPSWNWRVHLWVTATSYSTSVALDQNDWFAFQPVEISVPIPENLSTLWRSVVALADPPMAIWAPLRLKETPLT